MPVNLNPVKLSTAALGSLPDTIAVPSYDRAGLTAGILHIGVGNFHRAHQASYLDALFDQGHDHDWAIIGAGIKPGDAVMRERLASQDWLTTIIELDPVGDHAKICGSMIGFAECRAPALIEALSKPEIRIASMTITEGGYFLNDKTGKFRADDPAVIADLENPSNPQTVFGILAAALNRRRTSGAGPLTVLSCDNLPGNGHIAQQAVLALAAAHGPDLTAWIEDHVTFPNNMVDCITPATSDHERQLVTEKFGIDDAAPVVCEPFRQWVLEDRFAAGRPQLERVGVEFVSDVGPHELMKLRILNGGHATISYPSALLGIETVAEAMADPRILGFLNRLEREEIIPIVPSVMGVVFEDYLDKVIDRFANPKIRDTIARLCFDGSNRQPKFILPTIQERLDAGLSVDGLALEVALWCRYCAGVDEAGNQIDVQDERRASLTEHAQQARSNPRAFLAQREIFGTLADADQFAACFDAALSSLWRDGVSDTLRRYAGEGGSMPTGKTAAL